MTTTVYNDSIGGWTISPTTLLSETTIDETFGQTFDFPGSGTVGPYTFGFEYQQHPGFFNSSTNPSSGFFNSGGGGASGFFNSADGAVSGLFNDFADTSGFRNDGGPGNSGYLNDGGLISGLVNVGNTLSGVGNVGTELSGFFDNFFSR